MKREDRRLPASASATTGGTRMISLSRPGIGNAGANRPLSNVFTSRHAPEHQDDAEDQPGHPGLEQLGAAARRLGQRLAAAWSRRESSCERSAGEVQISFGCQTRRNSDQHAIETTAAPISTIQGLT